MENNFHDIVLFIYLKLTITVWMQQCIWLQLDQNSKIPKIAIAVTACTSQPNNRSEDSPITSKRQLNVYAIMPCTYIKVVMTMYMKNKTFIKNIDY